MNIAKRDWIWMSIVMLLLIMLILTNVVVKPQEIKKDRTEKLWSVCENWEICDYKEDITCPSMYCPEKYQCWREQRNCEIKKVGVS